MYNGIGLTTPRGSGTNGYVQRNLSYVRKTKEKVKEQTTEDNAVRSYDPELIEHERRRQIEVRCLELRELLEEEEMDEGEIEVQVTKFRAKLMEEKKTLVLRDSSGRPMVKDSHELAVAQEDKNERAKNAFGIRDDFIPGSSLDNKRLLEQDVDAEKSGPPRKVTKKEMPENVAEKKKDTMAEVKPKKARSPSSSSSSGSSDSSSDSSSSDSSTDSSDSSSSSETSSDESESDRERRRRKKSSSKTKKGSSEKKEKHRSPNRDKSERSRTDRSRSTLDSSDRPRKSSDRNRR